MGPDSVKPVATAPGRGGGAGAWLRRLWRSLQARWAQAKAPGHFLCDSCRYDYGNACRQPGRPNATRCPDYRARI